MVAIVNNTAIKPINKEAEDLKTPTSGKPTNSENWKSEEQKVNDQPKRETAIIDGEKRKDYQTVDANVSAELKMKDNATMKKRGAAKDLNKGKLVEEEDTPAPPVNDVPCSDGNNETNVEETVEKENPKIQVVLPPIDDDAKRKAKGDAHTTTIEKKSHKFPVNETPKKVPTYMHPRM